MILTFLTFALACNCARDKTLKYESDIKLEVTSAYNYKGVITYNDSIAVTNNCPQIFKNDYKNNYYGIIENLSVPFQLIKRKNSDTIKIVKNYDSLYFKLIEF